MAKLIPRLDIFQCIAFTLFGTIIAATVCETQCSPWRQTMLVAAGNRALRNFRYLKKPVHSRVVCGRECNMDELCRSINFYECNNMCLFNNATRAEHPEGFAETQGSVYFDTDGETPLFSMDDNPLNRAGSCKELLEAGNCTSGVYAIYPDGLDDSLMVYCDMETDDGGWIVFQRRHDGSVDFYRVWDDYKSGFGNLSGEFWLGNEKLVTLTSNYSQGKVWELRVDLEDWENNTAWAKYKDFKISRGEYNLNIGQYDASSTAGLNSLYFIKGKPFSTRDKDNDADSDNCAEIHKGAWWFDSCSASHLNGRYYQKDEVNDDDGIYWNFWKAHFYSLKKCSMKIRESDP